ncbi:hypothetical protein Glove_416g17 [Diversispora epigaea]|uniref:Uncharacterized protein n=1 Tax=Diversispora epigaea TaxID=1348612 RepID=A0A397H0Z2_9GLOM|nr:hypothetical protein Glove_416g17 [Diversispora epigaea]
MKQISLKKRVRIVTLLKEGNTIRYIVYIEGIDYTTRLVVSKIDQKQDAPNSFPAEIKERTMTLPPIWVKRGTWNTKSQMSFASVHIKRLLPYHSYKVYPKTLAKIAKSSAHIPNLLPYRSYKMTMEKTSKDLTCPKESNSQ